MAKRSPKPIPPPLSDDELRDYAIAKYIANLLKAENESITFCLQGVVVPKARPRVTKSGQAYIPPNYRAWKEQAIESLRGIRPLYPQHTFPLEQANAMFVLDGKHSRGSDGDNLSGALNDALVQAGILREDNLLHVPEQAVMLNYDKSRSPSTLIVLY
jgi:Holliday junction resolvase RusA-like endonuclease